MTNNKVKKRALEHYNIWIGNLNESHIEWLRAQQYGGVAVLVDENTHRDCWPLLEKQLRGLNVGLIKISAGETHKTLETCQFIWQQLFEMGAGRNWCLLNLGGGVIGDMGGFCAATFKRGMDFVQIPTTLLSQVDASVGGKLGIDFFQLKNSIGIFKDPAAVWADAQFLKTLDKREVRSGFAEIIKHALIADEKQWQELKEMTDLEQVNWSDWVDRSVAIKQNIVTNDPFEKGLRKALNFGHTIGHAIESLFLETENRLLHGEAIAAGMICEAYIATQQCGLTKEELEEITSFLLSIYGHQTIPEGEFDYLEKMMRQDKKNETTAINFSLISKIGQCKVNEIATMEEIKKSIQFYNKLRITNG